MKTFTYHSLPARVVFSRGSRFTLPAEAERLGLSRLLVLSTPQQAELAETLRSLLGDAAVGTFTGAVMHTPISVTEAALAKVAELKVDGVVAVGGGSTTGLGKAIAYRTDLPQIVLPTTYAGSEMTPVLGETADGVKKTMSSPRILPESVIYDVELTTDLPPMMAGVSGLNAIAHAVEALYARERNPITSLMAIEGIGALARALPSIKSRPGHIDAHEEALYGAWLCGICLGTVGMALHHKLCHTLGGSFGLPHAETHAVVLPYALAYNLAAIEEPARLAAALNSADPVTGLAELARKLGVPGSLREIGLAEDDVERAADLAMANAYWNPRPLQRDAIRDLIAHAQRGDPPQMLLSGIQS